MDDMDTGMGDREPIEDVYTPLGQVIWKLNRALRSHMSACAMCNGEWRDGPCMVGVGLTSALEYLTRDDG